MTVSPTFGIADLQTFSFDVSASDPDGDPLSYQWDLGLGATATGRTAAAKYEGGQSATYPVSVRVSDGKGGTATGSVSVAVGSVNGHWLVTAGAFSDGGGNFALLQNSAGVVTGQYGLPGAGSLELLTNGQITTAGVVTLPLRLGSHLFTFTGTMETTGRRIPGVVNGDGYASVPCVLTLQ